MSADDFLTDPARACASPAIDPDRFFSASDTQQNLARRVCNGTRPEQACPVRQACLTYALRRREQFGVWAGVLMSSAEEVADALTNNPLPPAAAAARQQNNLNRKQLKKRNEEGVRKYWLQKKSDLEISLALGISFGAVSHIRRRLGLKALYGPGGRRLDQAVNA